MPHSAWSEKRERQYEHIKRGLLQLGTDEERAEEIATRTVNKERAGRTYDQLRHEAKRRGIKGRSRMSKAQLERAPSR